MRPFAALFLIACLGSVCAGRAPAAAVNDARAGEAVTIFENYCVVNGGTRDEAQRLIDGSLIAKRLPENVIQDLQSGRKGGVGWQIATPHDGRLILAYDPIGVCEVAIVSANGDAVRQAFQVMIGDARKQLKVPISEGEAQSQKIDGSTIVVTPYSFQFLGKMATLTLTSADKTMPIGFQHTMTSTFTKLQR